MFVTLDIREMDYVSKGTGFFSGTKEKLQETGKTVSIPASDISYLEEGKDDFNTPFTFVHLKDNSALYYQVEDDYVLVPGTVAQNQNLINSSLGLSSNSVVVNE